MDGYAPLASGGSNARQTGRLFSDRSLRFLTMAGRLKPGISLAGAQTAAEIVARRMEVEYPATDRHTTVRVLPEPLARPVPLTTLARVLPVIKAFMFILAALVLLIACMNVANLLLVRATVRQREMAVRAALGSSPSRLIRLVLSEGLVLAALGATMGLAAGRWSIDLLIGWLDLGAVGHATNVPIDFEVDFDWRVFVYALTITFVTGVLVAMLPALRASGANVTDLLHDGARGESGRHRPRLRSLLVVAQVAGSLVLLIVAGLFVRNLQRAQAIDLGFDPVHVVTARLDPRQIGYDQARMIAFYEELDRRLRAIPGVVAASQAFSVPMGYVIGGGSAIEPEGVVAPANEPRPSIGYNSVSPVISTRSACRSSAAARSPSRTRVRRRS